VGGAQPRKEGVRGAAPRKKFDDFLSILGKNVLVLKDRILGNTKFQKTGSYVTGRPDCSGPSHREVKIDVWKYLQTIVMGLYAVSEQKLAHLDRVRSPELKTLNSAKSPRDDGITNRMIQAAGPKFRKFLNEVFSYGYTKSNRQRGKCPLCSQSKGMVTILRLSQPHIVEYI